MLSTSDEAPSRFIDDSLSFVPPCLIFIRAVWWSNVDELPILTLLSPYELSPPLMTLVPLELLFFWKLLFMNLFRDLLIMLRESFIILFFPLLLLLPLAPRFRLLPPLWIWLLLLYTLFTPRLKKTSYCAWPGKLETWITTGESPEESAIMLEWWLAFLSRLE